MEILIKQGQRRIDPKHPDSTDPDLGRARLVGQERVRLGKMKFENDSERRDYVRAVSSNPSNVYGLPNFFPPIVPKVALGGSLTEADVIEERILRMKSRQTTLFCHTCNCQTIFYLSDTQGFCESCKTPTKYRVS